MNAKIYTKTGDDGTTQLCASTRFSKIDARISAMGSVDELNAYLGLLRIKATQSNTISDLLFTIQKTLFDIVHELAEEKKPLITEKNVAALEQTIDQFEANLPPLKNFITPGDNELSAYCHIARTICRRAEREYVALQTINPETLKYLNRLSDLLFIIARVFSEE